MIKRNTIQDIKDKKGKEKIFCLTAYTYNIAKIIDEYCDILLVGDSLGMVIYGMDSTLDVDLQMMINHSKAVVKASEKSLVVVDLPFGSYQSSPQQAFKNASKILAKTSAGAVKLEGGEEMSETINFLTKRGIPVMGHIGLKPQSFNITSGYKKQGKTSESQNALIKDLKAIEKAGVFAVVVEAVDEKATAKIMKTAKTPIIGIASGEKTDGQVLVINDLLGLSVNIPNFVKNNQKLNINNDENNSIKQNIINIVQNWKKSVL